jgi:hypothetical protein
MIIPHILWIDDEFDTTLEGFIDEAYESGLDIKGFEDSDKGLEYLRNNISKVDGIILDALFLKDANSEEALSRKALHKSLQLIAQIEIENKTAFPKLIYTGQDKLLGDTSFKEEYDDIEVYDKNDDSSELFTDLKSMINKRPQSILKTYYSAFYEAATSTHFEQSSTWSNLHPLIEGIHFNTPPTGRSQYNALRHSLDQISKVLSDASIIPPVLVGETAALQLISLFISGKNAILSRNGGTISVTTNVFPKLIQSQFEFVYRVKVIGSHAQLNQSDPTQSFSISDYDSSIPDHQLLRTLSFMLMDLVVWTNEYVKQNPDPQVNSQNWQLAQHPAPTGAVQCDGEIISSDKYQNLYVRPDAGQGVTDNIRLHHPSQTNGLSIGDRVNTTSNPPQGHASFRIATSATKL